jgi:hypothetical protein
MSYIWLIIRQLFHYYLAKKQSTTDGNDTRSWRMHPLLTLTNWKNINLAVERLMLPRPRAFRHG